MKRRNYGMAPKLEGKPKQFDSHLFSKIDLGGCRREVKLFDGGFYNKLQLIAALYAICCVSVVSFGLS